ncbi:MAG: SPFH domain-containing protein [Anaerolineae bacterium]|jgi:regulator of protease activity HflC (stomatin/prohibitin superfamily)|nr:SPFH domain-containing protein [Anaerolineae bacterium]
MGISDLLGTVSLLGFVLFIAGIGLAVVSVSQGRAAGGGVFLAIVGLVVGFLFSLISGGILIVGPTEVAVITNTLNGTLEEPERGAGTSIIIPLIQQSEIYPTRQQEYTMSGVSSEGARAGDDAVDATTVDGQQVSVDVTIIFAINREEANRVHLRWGDNYIDGFIRPTARTVVRDVIARLPAEEIYGERRNEMQLSMQTEMETRMADEGLILSDFLVRGLTFSTEFAQAIEDKEIEQQRVQQAEQAAQRRRTEAQGEADAALLRAQGESDAAVVRAQGEAEALRLVSEQIAVNPSLIQYLYVQNLSDNVSLILVPTSGPFLFDFNSLAQAGSPGLITPPSNTTP